MRQNTKVRGNKEKTNILQNTVGAWIKNQFMIFDAQKSFTEQLSLVLLQIQ